MESKQHNRYHERLTADNAVLLLIDHQIGLFTGARDIDVAQLKHNVAGGTFSETKRITGILRMLQAGVIVTDYAAIAVEMLRDNASPLARDLYAAIDMPFATLVGQLFGAYSKVPT
ncbi:MAG: hypothetical protein MN733_37640 [Nitrososphaera sp.]|nr:hypothetical protein [Nitrososphaera sp.]